MAIVSIKWAGLKDPNKQPSFQDATGAAPVLPTPTFTSATTSSYTVAIIGYDAQFTYTVSASVGSAVRTDGNVTVSGLSANQSSTLTVTAANTARDLSFTSSAAFLSLPATPTLTQATQNTTGGTVTITNYDASVTYTISITAGSASRTGNTITVTGLTRGQTATLSVTASNSSGNSGTATLVVAAEPLGEFESIATIVVPSGGMSSITFNNIPQGYQNLQLRIIARTDYASNNDGLRIRLNSDSGSNYAYHEIFGNGSIAGAYGLASQTQMGGQGYSYICGASAPANDFGAVIVDIIDYTSISKTKTLRWIEGSDWNTSGGGVVLRSSLWNSTSAISTITLIPNAGPNFVQYTTAALYGIKA